MQSSGCGPAHLHTSDPWPPVCCVSCLLLASGLACPAACCPCRTCHGLSWRLAATAAGGGHRPSSASGCLAYGKAGPRLCRHGEVRWAGAFLLRVPLPLWHAAQVVHLPYCQPATWYAPSFSQHVTSLAFFAVDRRLLWRELWAGSSGAADWWQRQRAFTSSAAAMSMVRPCFLRWLPGVGWQAGWLLGVTLSRHCGAPAPMSPSLVCLLRDRTRGGEPAPAISVSLSGAPAHRWRLPSNRSGAAAWPGSGTVRGWFGRYREGAAYSRRGVQGKSSKQQGVLEGVKKSACEGRGHRGSCQAGQKHTHKRMKGLR